MEQRLESVGDVQVVQGQGVAVLAQCGGRVLVAQSLLGLQQVTLDDQGGGHGVPEPVDRDLAVGVPAGEAAELLGQDGAGHPAGVVQTSGEQPCSPAAPLCSRST